MFFDVMQPEPVDYPNDFKTCYSIHVPGVLVARARNNYLNVDLFEVRCNETVINIEVDGIEEPPEEGVPSAESPTVGTTNGDSKVVLSVS